MIRLRQQGADVVNLSCLRSGHVDGRRPLLIYIGQRGAWHVPRCKVVIGDSPSPATSTSPQGRAFCCIKTHLTRYKCEGDSELADTNAALLYLLQHQPVSSANLPSSDLALSSRLAVEVLSGI